MLELRRVNVGLCTHSTFFLPALLKNMFPALQRYISFRNDKTKGIERLNGLTKVSSELETKIYEYEPSFTLLFIQTLKYMTWKWGVKEVQEWEVLQTLPRFFPLYAFTKFLNKMFYIQFFKESFTCVNETRYEWLLIHRPDGCSGGELMRFYQSLLNMVSTDQFCPLPGYVDLWQNTVFNCWRN